MKKLLASLLFALVLCTLIPFAATSVFAAEDEKITIQVSIEETELKAGDEFEVTVNLLNIPEPGLIGALVKLSWDEDVMEIVTYYDEDEEDNFPMIEVGDKYNASSNKYITYGPLGTCNVQYNRATAKETQTRYEEHFFTATFRIKDDAAPGDYTITVKDETYQPKNFARYGNLGTDYVIEGATITIGGSACEHTNTKAVANKDGTHNVVCSDCNAAIEGEVNVPCSGGEATCTAKAVCQHCNTAYGPEPVGHEYFYACDPQCMNCGELTNPDAAHSMIHVDAVAATCTAAGNIEYWYCGVCGGCWDNVDALGMPLSRYMVILPQAEHESDAEYSCQDGNCVNCGAEMPATDDHSSLRYDSNRNGTHNVVCGVCGETTEKNVKCTPGSFPTWECPVCGGTCDHANLADTPHHISPVTVTQHVYYYICNDCECSVLVYENHTGGTATCTAKAVCQHCSTAYGPEPAGHNWTLTEYKWESSKNVEGYSCTAYAACSCGETTSVVGTTSVVKTDDAWCYMPAAYRWTAEFNVAWAETQTLTGRHGDERDPDRHGITTNLQKIDEHTHQAFCYYCQNYLGEPTAHDKKNVHFAGSCLVSAEYTCTCGYTYRGELNSDNHAAGDRINHKDNEDGTHTAYHPCCETDIETVAHTYDATTHICACGKVETFTVIWIKENGDVVHTETVEYGKDAQNIPDIPYEKTGYTASWSHNGKGITENTTVTMVFTENIYRVQIYSSDGSNRWANRVNKYTTWISTSATNFNGVFSSVVFPEGHGVVGFSAQPGGEMVSSTTILSISAITNNAVYDAESGEYIVKLYVVVGPLTYRIVYWVDGIIYENQSYKYGEEIKPLTRVPSKNKNGCIVYTFAGWDKEIPATMPAGNLDINATFTESKEHTVELTHVSAKTPTCTEKGNVEYWTCGACGKYYLDATATRETTATAVLLAPSCSYSAIYSEGVEAGCHTNGLKEHWYCANCDVYYRNAECSIVTNEKNLVIPAENQETICVDNGDGTHTKKYKCCNTDIETVAHTYGATTHVCVCDKVEEFIVIFHDWLNNVEHIELSVPYGANIMEALKAAAAEGKIPAIGDFASVNDELNKGVKVACGYRYIDMSGDEPTWADLADEMTMPAGMLEMEVDVQAYGWWYNYNEDGVYVGAEYNDKNDGWLIEGWYFIEEDFDDVAGGAWYYFAPGTGEWENFNFRVEDITWTTKGGVEGYYAFDHETGKWLSNYTGIYEAANGDLYYINNGVAVKNYGLFRNYKDGEAKYYYFGCGQKDCTKGCNEYIAQKNGIHWAENTYSLLPKWDYEFDANGVIVHDDALNNSEFPYEKIEEYDGKKYYTIDGIKVHAGLVKMDGNYYYARSSGELVVNATYWCTDVNGLLPEGNYTFDENGRMVNVPEIPEAEDKFTGIKDGYYYENGVVTYAGLIEIDGAYYYVKTSGEIVVGRTYWITKTNGLMGEMAYTFDEEGKMQDPVVKELDKDGIVLEDNDLYYYVGGMRTYAGLIKIGANYYYVNSNGQVITGKTYWISKTNGLMAEGSYTFDETGKMVNPPAELPEVEENFTGFEGGYYYENGVRTYAGLIEKDGAYYYVNTQGQVITGKIYWITKTNGLMEEKAYTFDEEGKMILN